MSSDTKSKLIKGEKTDERTYKLRLGTIDVYWRFELGADWNLWF